MDRGGEGIMNGYACFVAMHNLDRCVFRSRSNFEDAHVPTGSTRCHESLDHVGMISAMGQFEAGPAGLGNLKGHPAPTPDVADAGIGFERTGNGQIFTQAGIATFVPNFCPPIRQVFRRIDVHRLVRSTVIDEVCLAITDDVSYPNFDWTIWQAVLPDPREHGLTASLLDDNWLSHIHRKHTNQLIPLK